MAPGTNDPVYINEHYVVFPDVTEYRIINRRTHVREGVSETLSSAISKSDVWSDLMEEIKERKQCDA